MERNAHSSTETDKFIWFNGFGSIIIVALQDLSMLTLPNFLPHGEQISEPIPLKAAMADSHSTIVILYTISHIDCLAYYTRRRKEPTNYMVDDFLPESKVLLLSKKSGVS